MNWRAWAASLVLHSAVVALLVGFAGADPSLRRPERWQVQLAFAAPPEPPPAPPSPSVPAPHPPVHSPVPTPLASAVTPSPTVATQRPKLSPAPTVQPLPRTKRDSLSQPRQPPRPAVEKPVSAPRKPSPLPPTVALKAAPRPSKQPATSSAALSRPIGQEVLDSSRPGLRETRQSPPEHRTAVGHPAARPTTRDHPPPARSSPESGAANWNAALRAKLREMRVYPPIARRLGQEGIVTLLLEIGANGDLRGLAVRQSSGHAVLDQAAQQLARNAVSALRGQLSPPGESRLEIPVAYRLDR